MRGNESYDPLKEGCLSKINNALDKYTMNTLNYNNSNNFTCEENNETFRENTLNMNVTSDEDNELETYSSIILDKINNFKPQDEKIICEESRREPNIYANMSTLLNFLREQNKMNTLHIKNFIIENLKITEEIKHDKDINNLMRRIEHEEIKELIWTSGKRYFMEIKKIYLLMKKFNKERYFINSNKDILKTYSFKKNKNIKNLLQASIKKKNIQIQKILKQYIILKGYYKKVCNKYKQENELLKTFFSFPKNQSYYLNLKYSPQYCRSNHIYFYSYKKWLRRKRLRRTSHFKKDRYVIQKEYFTNSIFRKYTHHKKRYKEIICDILNDNKLLNLKFKKYEEKYKNKKNKKNKRKKKKKKKKSVQISTKRMKDKKNLDISYKRRNKYIYTHLFLPMRLQKKINSSCCKYLNKGSYKMQAKKERKEKKFIKHGGMHYVEKEEESIINKEEENNMNKEEENIINKEEENIINKDEENIINKDEENIINKDEESIMKKDEERIINKEEENNMKKKEDHIINKEEENNMKKKEDHIINKEEENNMKMKEDHIINKEEENNMNKEEENIINKEEDHIINKDEENIINKDEESIMKKKEDHIINKDEENIMKKKEDHIINKDEESITYKKEENIIKIKNAEEVTKNDDDTNMIKIEEKEKYDHKDEKENMSIGNIEECNKMKEEYYKKENTISDIEDENIILDPKEENIMLDTKKEKLILKEKKKKKNIIIYI
ncbi:conserved Plasmodium protein, unknown function [Plasmodium gaboni]|uniref:Uncharacterized protein n=1 Tax=Plasmodium gaboni TaxID=647221 RepID=A0ABY0KWX5_9APIC|nr:conserved Plasmodium protein, unknown function [Plasmodium gaboni]